MLSYFHLFCSIHGYSPKIKNRADKKNRARPPQGIARVPFPRTIEVSVHSVPDKH